MRNEYELQRLEEACQQDRGHPPFGFLFLFQKLTNVEKLMTAQGRLEKQYDSLSVNASFNQQSSGYR